MDIILSTAFSQEQYTQLEWMRKIFKSKIMVLLFATFKQNIW